MSFCMYSLKKYATQLQNINWLLPDKDRMVGKCVKKVKSCKHYIVTSEDRFCNIATIKTLHYVSEFKFLSEENKIVTVYKENVN